MRITQKEIARKLGVSTMTVSRVLSGKISNKVSAALVEKIRETAAAENYRENRLAKAMREGIAPLSALCLHRFLSGVGLNLYWFDLISHYTRIMTENHFEVTFVPYATTEELAERLETLQALGLISSIVSNILPGKSKETIAIMKSIQLPYALLGHPEDEEVPYVYVDQDHIPDLLLESLSAEGARRLEWFASPLPLPSAGDAADPGVFFQVPGPMERNLLICKAKIPAHRVFIVTSNLYMLAGFSGFLINGYSQKRCENAFRLIDLQRKKQPIPVEFKIIEITRDDIARIPGLKNEVDCSPKYH